MVLLNPLESELTRLYSLQWPGPGEGATAFLPQWPCLTLRSEDSGKLDAEQPYFQTMKSRSVLGQTSS